VSDARRLAAALLMLAVVLAPGRAAAQVTPQAYRLESLDGYVELAVRGRNHDRSREGAGTRYSQDELFIDEILHLDLGGFVYHPNLVHVNGGLDLHFLQDLIEGKSFILPGGGVRLDLLQRKPYGLNAFAQVVDNDVQQRFGPTLGVRSQIYGGSVRYDPGSLPLEIFYRHRRWDQTGDPLGKLHEIGDEVGFRARYDLPAGTRGDLRYDFVDETVREQGLQRHEFFANNTTYFGGDRRKRLSAIGRMLYSSGANDISSSGVFGTYDWEHTDTLSSSYHFDYQLQSLDSQTSNHYGFRGSILHDLYGSLATHLSAFGAYQDASFGESAQYGVRLEENYRKRLGSWGRLRIGVAPFTEVQQNRPTRTTGFVLGESAVFPVGEPFVQLLRQDVDTASIVVRHAACGGAGNICDPTFDYRVSSSGDGFTQIERLVTGDIPSDEEVLIDYEYLQAGNSDLLLYGSRTDAELSYRDWGSVFVEAAFNREDGIRGTRDPRRGASPDRQAIGLRMRRDWISAVAVVDREDGDFRSSIGNYQTVSLRMRRPTWWNGSLVASHRGRDWSDPSEAMNGWRLSANVNARLWGGALLEVLAEYEREEWRGGNYAEARNFDGVSVSSSLQWRFREIEVKLGATTWFMDRLEARENQERFYLRVRRYF
jgi:hypothetical protein